MKRDNGSLLQLLRNEQGQEIIVRPRPFRIKHAELTGVVAACERAWRFADKVLSGLCANPRAPAIFTKHEPYWNLVRAHARRHRLHFARFDFRLADGEPYFFELNTNCPAGGAFFAQWRRQADMGAPVGFADGLADPLAFASRLVACARAEGRTGGSLNIVLATDSGGLTLELPYLREILGSMGHRSEIAEVSSLRLDGRVLLDEGGREVDLVYCKCNPVQSFSPGWTPAYRAQCSDFLRAWAEGLVTVRNPPASILLAEDKAFLELLAHSDERVARNIPQTRVLASLDPLDRDDLLRSRQSWVIKPRQESRGRGVICGPFAGQPAWEAAVMHPDAQDYVVQRFVGDDAGGPGSRTMTALMLEGKVEGLFNRVSDGAVNNVAAGAEIELIESDAAG